MEMNIVPIFGAVNNVFMGFTKKVWWFTISCMETAMKHDDFDSALKALGYTRERFAEIAGLKSATTVQNWATGAVKVPGPVEALIEFLVARPESRAWFEARRPPSADSQPRRVRRKGHEGDAPKCQSNPKISH
jgi:hypothetical protein